MLILLHSVSQITKVILETSEHTKESYGHKACQTMHTCKGLGNLRPDFGLMCW